MSYLLDVTGQACEIDFWRETKNQIYPTQYCLSYIIRVSSLCGLKRVTNVDWPTCSFANSKDVNTSHPKPFCSSGHCRAQYEKMSLFLIKRKCHSYSVWVTAKFNSFFFWWIFNSFFGKRSKIRLECWRGRQRTTEENTCILLRVICGHIWFLYIFSWSHVNQINFCVTMNSTLYISLNLLCLKRLTKPFNYTSENECLIIALVLIIVNNWVR